MSEETKGSMPEIMRTPEAVNQLADKIEAIQRQEGKQWDQQCNGHWIAAVVWRLFEVPKDDPRVLWLLGKLQENGMGGNASQTRQWGNGNGKPGKGRGWLFLEKGEKPAAAVKPLV